MHTVCKCGRDPGQGCPKQTDVKEAENRAVEWRQEETGCPRDMKAAPYSLFPSQGSSVSTRLLSRPGEQEPKTGPGQGTRLGAGGGWTVDSGEPIRETAPCVQPHRNAATTHALSIQMKLGGGRIASRETSRMVHRLRIHSLQCRGSRFNPWSGTTSHIPQSN